MKQIIMLSGFPGSGKSTYAYQLLKENKNHARVNRDDIRKSVFNGAWTAYREATVINIEKMMVKALLADKYTPIIDDTNLTSKTQKMWQNFADDNDAVLKSLKMNTSIEECVRRDSGRTESRVGQPVIHMMALRAGMIDFGEKPIIIVDLDGTIADETHRHSFIEGKNKDWGSYFKGMAEDGVYEDTLSQVKSLAENHTVIISTGRPTNYFEDTKYWLQHVAKLDYDYIFMRGSDDRRADIILKEKVLEMLPQKQITTVFEDREHLCRMYEAHNIDVTWARGKEIHHV